MISVRRLVKIMENIEIDSLEEDSYSTIIWPNEECIIEKSVLMSIVYELLLRRKGEYLEKRGDFNPRGPQKGDSDYHGF